MKERLTIDEIIEHCKKQVDRLEKYIYKDKPGEMRNIDKEYWEHKQVKNYLEELKRYRELEEKGNMLILPCNPGDTVFYIYMDCPPDYKEMYCIDHQGGCARCHHRVPTIMSKKYTLDDIDMHVYLTELEAQEALERMKNEKS